jgi:hypothetical protein
MRLAESSFYINKKNNEAGVNVKEIIIKNDKIIFVDDIDYNKAIQYQWIMSRKDKHGHVVTRINGKAISYKNLILGISTEKRTLFKNNNPLDLRKENIMVFDTVSEYVNALHKTGRIRANGEYKFNESVSKAAQGMKTHGKKNSNYIGVRLVPNVRQWQSAIKYARKNH